MTSHNLPAKLADTPPAQRWLAAVAGQQDLATDGTEPAARAAAVPGLPASPAPDPAIVALGRQFLEFSSRLLAERRRREEATGLPWTVRLHPVRADPGGVAEIVFSLTLEPGDIQEFARQIAEDRQDGNQGDGEDPA